MKLLQKPILFCLGGGLYGSLELLWRGRTHMSMLLLGGGCFLLLGRLRKIRLPIPVLTVLGAAFVTLAELGTGLLFNRNYAIWDYRQAPLNFMGQICLPYSLLWMPVSLMGMTVYGWAEKRL